MPQTTQTDERPLFVPQAFEPNTRFPRKERMQILQPVW
jgi:hypothetical protein